MAFDALADSIVEQGSDSARAYQAIGGTGESLMQVIAESAPQLGWGQWAFEKTDSGLLLTVRNSPFAEGFGRSDEPVCWPITGMMRAVSTLVLGRETQASEIACKAAGADACCFKAEPAGTAP
jgi:predicted hydrocarbon binding protein